MTAAGEFPPDVAVIVWTRDEGRCVDCGRQVAATRRAHPAYEGGWSMQHRDARGAGGVKRPRKGRAPSRPWLTRPANGAVMCGDGTSGCHGRAETKDRARAYALGFAIRSGIRLPSDIPIRHAVHGWVRLLDESPWFEALEAAEVEELAA